MRTKDFFKRHTILFCILAAAVALFSNLSVAVLETFVGDSLTGGFVADAVCKYIVAILPLYIMVKWGYTKKTNPRRLAAGFLLGALCILFAARNLLPLVLVNPMLFQVQWGLVIIILIDVLGIGLLEEAGLRGVIIPFLCEKWQDKKHPCLLAAFVSSLLFGCIHLNWSVRYFLAYGELTSEFLFNNLYQVYYAFCFGMLAAGICMYSRSILPMVIWHGFCDFSGFLSYGILPLTTLETYYSTGVLTPQNFLNTYGILKGFHYGDELIFGIINLLYLVVGIVLATKAEKHILLQTDL